MTKIELIINNDQLTEEIYSNIISFSPYTTHEIIGNAVLNQIKHQMQQKVSSNWIKRYKVFWASPYGSGYRPLNSLIQMTKSEIINLAYYEIEIVTDIKLSDLLHIDLLKFFYSIDRTILKRKKLKTIIKHKFEIHGAQLKSDFLIPALQSFNTPCKCSIDHLYPYISGVWDDALQFICRICGKSFICECFSTSMKQRYDKCISLGTLEKQGYLAKRLVQVFENSEIRGSICHLCRDLPSELFYCHPQYGSNILVHYGPYISKMAIDNKIDKREAENLVRDILGVPRIGEGWLSEVELLNIIKDIFIAEDVIHQARPAWLGKQRLDIFLPERNLAIEFQGLQHFQPVEFFGGENGLRNTQRRDQLKAELCLSNNVKLIYFRHDEPITKNYVMKVLQQNNIL